MRKLSLILIILFSISLSVRAQAPDPAQNALLAKILGALTTMKITMDQSKEELKALKKVYNTATDVQKFIDMGLATRKALDMLVCMSEQAHELTRLQALYGPKTNLFSGFDECQRTIFYGVLDVDYESVRTNIAEAFDFDSDIQLIDRIRAIERALEKIQDIQYKTVIVEKQFVEELIKRYQVDAKREWLGKLGRL